MESPGPILLCFLGCASLGLAWLLGPAVDSQLQGGRMAEVGLELSGDWYFLP